jgi:hypothetical protein
MAADTVNSPMAGLSLGASAEIERIVHLSLFVLTLATRPERVIVRTRRFVGWGLVGGRFNEIRVRQVEPEWIVRGRRGIVERWLVTGAGIGPLGRSLGCGLLLFGRLRQGHMKSRPLGIDFPQAANEPITRAQVESIGLVVHEMQIQASRRQRA